MASMAEISVEMQRLVDAMPPPRGVDAAKAFQTYCDALTKFTTEEIQEGIRRFLSAECDPKISLKFYPRPPELAKIVGGVHAERMKVAAEQARKEQLARDRAEMAESAKLAIKTPEQKARAAELMRRLRAGEPVDPAHVHRPRSFDMTSEHLPPPISRDYDQPRNPMFAAASRDPYRARRSEKPAPETPQTLQHCSGMTEEEFAAAMAKVPDSNRVEPLPDGMKQLAEATPGIPEPIDANPDDDSDKPFGGLV